MPPRRDLRINNVAPHSSSTASGHEERAAQREGVQGSNVPPVPQMPRVPGINDQELMEEFARFLAQRRREDGAALEIPVRAEPLGALERVLMRFQKQKPSNFKGTTSDPVQAAEWISEMEDIFDVMDISEEHKVICAAQVCKGEAKRARQFEEGLREDIRILVKTFQLKTYAEVLEKAQIIECDKRKEGVATGKFLGKRSMTSKENTSIKKFKKGFDICYDKPQCYKCHKRHLGECRMGMGVCYRCGGKGHMARDCNAPLKDTVGQHGGNREPANGTAGPRQKGNARIFAVTVEDAERPQCGGR
ncbi:hypothetical protein NE237_031237 [Protea cynaroides]|uniref:CCHC-type domain-containing protein n=1 Tax=Protea cynaroides TaxID=273540 RepID=A0A9Q0R2E1_9MAGN|nr:hypothetical protein NE237_031237 [Protea cynaroides]